MKRILALDLGTRTGWAVSGATIEHGTYDLSGSRYEGGGMRFVRFRDWIAGMWLDVKNPIEAVYFEEVRRHLGTDAAHLYGGLLATLCAECEQLAVPYIGFPVGTIKKYWTGKGNASKQDMIDEAVRRGFAPEDKHGRPDDNQADALALLHLALDTIP